MYRRHCLSGLRGLLLLGALAACSAATAAEIYRSEGPDGAPVFSDVPPAPGRPAEPVELAPSNRFEPVTDERVGEWNRQSEGSATADVETADFPGYRTLRVTSPTHDEAVRNNAGNVAVTVHLEPELQPDHRLQVYLDGELAESARSLQFQLHNVDRGTHRVEVRVVDAAGEVLRSSDVTVFHLQRYSQLLAPNRGAGR